MYDKIRNMLVDGNMSCPCTAENDDGELVLIEAGASEDSGEPFYRLTTHQNNGWIRTNIYYQDGTCEELFHKDGE